MQVKLSENIKKFRKERKMTQEQLAEAMGVSVSAVYKWESNQSTPDIRLILELADLFHTSTDVLLGYGWQDKNAAAALERIKSLTKEKAYGEAVTEAEKALKSYPNHFDIVYQSGLLYLEVGENAHAQDKNHRAIGLLNHACELISQNQDDGISEVSIRTQIAKAHLRLGDGEGALRILKKYNVCGVNNAMIGMVLGDYFHDAVEAEKYLGKAFSAFAEDIHSIMIGYANVFFQQKNYDAAIECILRLRTVLRGTQPQGEWTWFDKYDCVLLETIAECYCFKGDLEKARSYLKAAAAKAAEYDRIPQGEIGGMKLYSMLHIEKQPTYDLYGKRAMDCLMRRMQPEDEGVPGLQKMWQEVTEEAGIHETV